MIRAIVWAAAGLNSDGRGSAPRTIVERDILQFCLRALGAEPATRRN
jgi:hypothetical protein